MNYCYDLKLNFQKNNYMFYEWDNSIDNIIQVKKIPLFYISTSLMMEILGYSVKVENEFLNKIKDKNTYYTLLADKSNVLALSFDNNGMELERSFLLLEDELNIIENRSDVKKEIINITKVKERKYYNDLRKERIIKNTIYKEIIKLLKNKNYQKLDYLYNEWFDEQNNDYDQIRNIIKNKLKGNITNQELKVYDLIMLSYKNV